MPLLRRHRLGFSEAAVIAFDSLKGLELTDNPKEVASGYDEDIVWEGLGFIPFALAVHYGSDHPESDSVDGEVAFSTKRPAFRIAP